MQHFFLHNYFLREGLIDITFFCNHIGKGLMVGWESF